VRSLPGTGLGLTITKLLTQIMGGEVQMHSSTAAGSTFVVRLMLGEVRDHKRAARPAQRICDYLGTRQKILLADDDPLHLELLQNLLRPLGFTMFIARDGKTCVQLAEQCQPDLAMIDLSLPDISGWEVAQQLRAMRELARLKIMIVSANAHEYSAAAGPLHDSFVTKPIELTPLLERVGTLLDLKWINQPERSAPPERELALARSASDRSRHHLDDLYRLGSIGHVRGIEAKLRELELEDPSHEAVAAHLRALVTNFDLKRYMNVLEAMRTNA
jgi:CheY-like chemotaxis protein